MAGVGCGRCLAGEGQLDALLGEDLVRGPEKRENASDAEVVDALVDDLLDFHGRDAEAHRRGDHRAELVDSLAAHERREDADEADLVVEVVGIRHLVEREVVEALDELGVGPQEVRYVAGEHPLVVGPRCLGDLCLVVHAGPLLGLPSWLVSILLCAAGPSNSVSRGHR